jgi:uncharacterized membrane protein YeiH
MLNRTLYEALRWIIAIVLPAIGVLIVTINNVWNLGWPAEQISLTLDAVGLFLGAIFGISKVVNDKKA